ncbi:MAG: alginate lyase family protein, partial [Actinomycetota bacterium]|nr:alginate lyase family protein [Actinomycetota bacterium]
MDKLLWGAMLITLTVPACNATTSTDLSHPYEEWPEERELVYPLLGEGDVATADLIRAGVWDLPRFDPVELEYPPTWTEDPHDENYWRFIFYGLRPLRHLIAAYKETGDDVYVEALAEILESFASARDDSPHITDPHAAAFRTMVQVASYGVLSRADFLNPDLEAKLRSSIREDAAFLADPVNFEGEDNHGFTEAAALLLVSETFSGAEEWGDIARRRLDGLMVEAVDADGVEVENSPFYHFYVMGFSADIIAWAERNDIAMPSAFSERFDKMADYAAWILMPNGEVPLLGSSVVRTVDTVSADELADLAADHSELDFVLSRGAAGEAPEQNSILFPEAGTAVLRSGFGTAETYGRETHIVFDVGPYRTNHSQLDALSVNVHAAGITIFPDSGLFTYEPGADFDYFHGTAAHNTVLVDGEDQIEGAAEAGLSRVGDGWSYQSGSHELYPGVSHRRAVVLIGKDLIVVVDSLDAVQPHDFAQLWHFTPEVRLRIEGGDIVAAHPDGSDIARIEQASDGRTPTMSFGDTGSHRGWYSELYEVKMANAVASYSSRAETTRFVT